MKKTEKITSILSLFQAAKWILFAVITGIIIGTVGAFFCKGLAFVTGFRGAYPGMIYLLPVAGVVIVALYRGARYGKDGGTNLIISSIHSNEVVPLRMAPLIFASTLLTHLCGGSAGREGAALQIGGSIGNALGKGFRLNDKDRHIMIMCGMSAAFAAVFGTPMAAAVFPLEMITVGIWHYSALFPCVVSALVARGTAIFFHVGAEAFTIPMMAEFTLVNALRICLVALLASLVSVLFCVVMHKAGHILSKYFSNPYVKVIAGGVILIILTFLVGDQTYSGSGVVIIEECFEGEVVPYAFLLKLLFTAICMGAGFKGGEIVPAFTVGAAFGCLAGNLLGFNPALCSAIGMIAVFCGATNCPIASLLIAFEMFGYEGMPFYLLTIAISYAFSGYFSLYHTQRFPYSKYETTFVNRNSI